VLSTPKHISLLDEVLRSHGKCSLTARLYWHNLKKCSNIVDRINNMTLVIRANALAYFRNLEMDFKNYL
jgi:hypothetical protein